MTIIIFRLTYLYLLNVFIIIEETNKNNTYYVQFTNNKFVLMKSQNSQKEFYFNSTTNRITFIYFHLDLLFLQEINYLIEITNEIIFLSDISNKIYH